MDIIYAKIVVADGSIFDRNSIGEELFWAIRGGSGASFGVILSWKIKLVPVPAKVTLFNVSRTLEKGATDVIYNWQYLAAKISEDIFIRTSMPQVKTSNEARKLWKFHSLVIFWDKVTSLFP